MDLRTHLVLLGNQRVCCCLDVPQADACSHVQGASEEDGITTKKQVSWWRIIWKYGTSVHHSYLTLSVCGLTQSGITPFPDLHPADRSCSGPPCSEPGQLALLLLSPAAQRQVLPQHHEPVPASSALLQLPGPLRPSPRPVGSGLRGLWTLWLPWNPLSSGGQVQCQPHLLLQRQM